MDQSSSAAQQYNIAEDSIKPTMGTIDACTSDWDDVGKVGWKAYHGADTGAWRMIFVEDKQVAGVKV